MLYEILQMDTIDIVLIIISGAGLIHGILLSTYLIFIKKNQKLSRILIAVMLLLMSIRVGKSVLFNFAEDVDFFVILIGLSMLLALGPLLYFYTASNTTPEYKMRYKKLLHFAPFIIMFAASFFMTEQWFIDHGIFWSFILLAFFYGHFAFYIYRSWHILNQVKPNLNESFTKSQFIVFEWSKYVIIGTFIIWVSYVLNVFERQIPYILGPILYSISVYFLTFKAFRLGALNYNGSVFKENLDNERIFKNIDAIISDQKLYLNSNLTLEDISKSLSLSTHQISNIINEQASMNFNNYINKFRIGEAKKLMKRDLQNRLTISSIAYDVGFNSLSTFNAAFKKFERITPSQYKKSYS